MQFVTQQDLFNTVTSWKYYLAIVYDLRPKIEFDACHVIKALNLDISSVHEDLSKIKESKAASIAFLKQQNGYENIEKSAVINVYFISGKNTDSYVIDVHAIFANCISPNRLYYLDVDFDTFKQNYSVICSSSSEQEFRESNIYRTPNEIIPGLFLGGYRTPEKMHLILQELKITHILNCAKEFTPNQSTNSYSFKNSCQMRIQSGHTTDL
ncbi:MAG: hypothetical protein EZS28_033459 [Streblomastix strix]|uniref:Rhodanese domain-containing protein n=1 Tax=Streblomastix strix TaxID=222440 RepID=A0A5J4UL62_9EUKA|nr:MAG: hypothetical protein EZS28_033459 [Streblomastix strix]